MRQIAKIHGTAAVRCDLSEVVAGCEGHAEVFKGRRKVVRELYGLTHILHNDLPEFSVCQSMILLHRIILLPCRIKIVMLKMNDTVHWFA